MQSNKTSYSAENVENADIWWHQERISLGIQNILAF